MGRAGPTGSHPLVNDTAMTLVSSICLSPWFQSFWVALLDHMLILFELNFERLRMTEEEEAKNYRLMLREGALLRGDP